MTQRANFHFTIWYFKTSGKFYAEAKVIWNIRTVGTAGPYMTDAVAKLRGLRDSGGQEALPGLSGEGWDGCIVINCEDGFP